MNINSDYNDCNRHGVCSIAPSITSFQQVMLTVFRALAYYVLELEKHNYNCAELKLEIVDGISNLVSSTIYPDGKLLDIVGCRYSELIRVKREYSKLCKTKNIACKTLKIPLKVTPDMSLTDILNQGQKLLENRQKIMFEILFLIIQSVSLSILKLTDYGKINDEAVDCVIDAVNLFNKKSLTASHINDYILKLSKFDKRLWKERFNAQVEFFGKFDKVQVSTSTRPYKAILVSGSNLVDFYNLLDTLKNEDIDIYSHGDLLIAHAFEKFREFKNLKGHFGSTDDNSVFDFATFPGAVVLTKHASQNIEHLIRGRIFTTDSSAPKGAVTIKDYKEVLDAAYKAKGFSKGRKKDFITVGYERDKLIKEFKNCPKSPVIACMANKSTYLQDYFKKLPKIYLSFSYFGDINVNIANNFPMFADILDILFENTKLSDCTFHFSKCDPNTLSAIVNLKDAKIYMTDCPGLNPALINSFIKLYGIKKGSF